MKANLKLHIAIIFFVTLAAFVNLVPGDFILDDYIVIADNAFLRSPGRLGAVFTPGRYLTDPKKVLFELGSDSFGAGESTYRPIATLSYMLNHVFAGGTPWGYRLVNVFIHIFNAILFYLFLTLLFSQPLLALLAALIFAVHPVSAEVLGCTAFRPNTLALLFSFSALLFYLRFRLNKRIGYLLLSAGSYILAMFSKETAVLLPVVVVTCDFYLEGFSWKALLSRRGGYLVFFAAALLFCAIFLFFMPPQQALAQDALRFGDNLLRMLDITGFYVKELFFPVDPLFIFPLQLKHSLWRAALGVLIFITAGFSLFRYKKLPFTVIFAMIWFFLWLLPMNNSFYSFRVPVAYRYLYMPLPGFALLLAYPLWRLWTGACCYLGSGKEKLRFLVPLSVCVYYMILCVFSNNNWKSELNLYLALEQKYTGAPFNQLGLGMILAKYGRYEEAEKKFQGVLSGGWQIDKNNLVPVYRTLGLIYLSQGKYAQAEEVYVKIRDWFPEVALVWADLAGCYSLQGKYELSLEASREALRISPGYAPAYLNKGFIYLFLSDYNKAAVEFASFRATVSEPLRIESDELLYSLLLDKALRVMPDSGYNTLTARKRLKAFIWKGESL